MKEDLDEIALCVQSAVESTTIVFPRWVAADHWLDPARSEAACKVVGVIRRVSNERFAASVRQEHVRQRRVVLLARRDFDVERPRFRVNDRVELA
jgi:hypothetical protein